MILHLTRILVPYDIAARPWKDGGFRDSYAWHKRTWECFPGRPKAARDFLTRLDDTGSGFRLLVLSEEQPVKPDWCPDAGWHTKQVADSFLDSARFSFSLLANPTVKKAAPRNEAGKRTNAKRIPVSKREDLLAWLERKGSQHGFRVVPAVIRTIPRPRQSFIKEGQAGLHSATEFVGTLEVVDRTAFRQAFARGIGSAKAFGFGMLCLSPCP
jgi:CRISPR system Cascade subunit CasE